MADALLSASLQVLFQRLASPELINFIRRRNLSDELLSELKRKLVVVLNVLDDAEVKQFSNPNVKEWLVHVKGAVYDAEDLLDEIATDALRCKMEAADSQTGGTLKAWKWNKFSASVKTPFAIKSMESRVRGMIDLLEKIALEKVGLGLAEGGGEKRSPRPRSPISTSLEDDSIVVGRDEIQKEMMEWLLSDNTTGDKMGVMSIVGMGGSGKTTLARRLYNDEEVKKHFDLQAWVCVSTEFLLIKLTKTILEEIRSPPTSADNLNLLQLQLKKQLSNKKFLLVLDDVWNLKPRDEEKLILLWMAEGLLHPRQNEGRRMEGIGESYFDELLAKSFFQKSFYGNASFQFLETLSFEDMQNWEKWLCRGEFPRLQKLFIRRCPKLSGKLPEQLLSLVEFQIDGCPQLLMASLTVPAICRLRMMDFGKLQLQMAGCDFTALQTSEIEILDVSQWSQLPMAPHQLSIRKCDYVESLLEEEISQTNIHDLKIYDCSFSRSLHKVGLPTTLKSLVIYECSKLEILVPELFRCHLPVLESLIINRGVIDDSLSLSFSLGIFPKLTHFRILNLKGLEKLSILVSEGDPTSLCSLFLDGCPDLESIELHALNLESCSIYRCSKLWSLAHAHSSVQELNLGSCPELLFQREGLPSNLRKLEITDFTPQVECDLQRLTSLTHFTINGGCEDIELFPKDCLLPSSLTSLQIVELSNLKSLDSRGLQQLTSLLQLQIRNCPELQFSTGSVLQHLISLKRLEIDGCSRLQSLTEVGLQHLTSLEMLSIENCPMLQSLTKHRRFLMINKVSIMTMEETCKHREKIEATDWELQQRKSVSPGPDSNLWQAFSEAGAQTTIASLLGPEMAITTNQPQKELLALKLGVLEQRVLQPPLLPALIFPDPPLEAIMPSCLLTQRRLRASWLLNLLNGLNERKLNPLILNSEPSKAWPWNKLKPFCTEQLDSLKFFICKYPKWGNWRKGRFLGAELLMFIALFKKNKKLLNPGIELMLHNVLL
uniref:Disease resistance RPP13-like protein 1 n=1 Tax=Vitis vinifera TaxID=29760 RepID=F6I6M7_VITVI